MLSKKLVTAQKRGETRALFLGLGMVACSVIMYFFIGITIVPSYKRSVWTNESMCKLIKATTMEKVHCLYNEGSGNENIFRYPCLQVQVNLTLLGQVVKLYHTEDTADRNPKCFYVPENMENYSEVEKLVKTITDNFRKHQTFSCYYDPSRKEESAILKRLYPPEGLILAFVWPSLMLFGGVLVIIMVKISQYISVLSASQYRASI
ncbi:calcium-activated potassium channel subunit beta-1 [Anolis carolinensis]|uniref:Potassium calcium-activated channel subfamily M regulatory beta subunit 1 n=1 Tax=Anolis carolinensis TaxID=28377 RepID=R4GAN8_ANOCA|nr:PREDICTED: calcium-activated potassium channel subunit beta-1 [Anolis carolinensis]XP_008102854.1 PREDICTED: calcium-activated potassium channel subunit beta-1 [Anolis carolinensis]|eukprot:XP_008102853.1 PREDICTED: calcium-activated potassium channel subunit beta-1 [Anolis carolinensis]